MPHVSTIISGAASLGVLAGVVSGIFYLVLTGIRWAGRLRAALQEEEKRRQNGAPPGTCVICGRPPDPLTPIWCQDCEGRACRGGSCSRRSTLGWTCLLCHVKRDLKKTPGSWLNQKPESEQTEATEEKSNNSVETVQVREFIEKLVETLVGGPLDGVTVGKLSSHDAYVAMFTKYHEMLCQSLARLGFTLQLSIANNQGPEVDSPSTAHAVLKKLVDKIVAEAMALPNIKERVPDTSLSAITDEDFTNKSYEDILATAILNKVIDKFQQQNGRRVDSIDSNSNVVREANSVGTESIQDEDLHSSSDWSDTSRTEPLSLTIEERIEEITTTFESSDEEDRRDLTEGNEELKTSRRVPFPELGMDILDTNNESENEESSESEDQHSSATELHSATNSWEENWLFQKKKPRTTPSAHHPVPVPMLVPNPSQEFRALIGGVDADDLSDMSECSDSVLEDVVMVESEVDAELTKQMVDALNEDLDRTETESGTEHSGEVKAVPALVEEVVSTDQEDTQGGRVEVNESPTDSLESETTAEQSLSQKDRECDVDFDSIHQIGVSHQVPVPLPRNAELINTEPIVTEKPPICPIAEREKAKWNNPVEMKDNPYSPENIAKRELQRQTLYTASNSNRSSSSSPASAEFLDGTSGLEEEDPQRIHRYGRDYYIRSARSPTGDFKVRSNPDSPRSVQSEASYESTVEDLIPDMKPVPSPIPSKPKILIRSQAVDVVDVTLPSVRKLAQQFTQDTPPLQVRTQSPSLTKWSSRDTPPLSTTAELGREDEIDYSVTPVAEIISTLTQKNPEHTEPTNVQQKVFEEVSQMEKMNGRVSVPRAASRTKVNGLATETPAERINHKFNPKLVHSLTARSISKEFREGLKKNSYQRVVKIDRGNSGENEQIQVCSEAQDRPQTPPIDLKKTKKFWEDIININKQNK